MNPLDSKPGMLDLSWRMFGTPVRVKIWFWLFMALFGYMMGLTRLGWQFLLLWVVCGFISVMIHELGHIIAGWCFGFPGAIILTSFGGGAIGEYQRAQRWQRIIIAASGPSAGFFFYAGVYAATHSVMSRLAFFGQWEELVFWGFPFLAFMNLFWNILNLPPILPMDGGMIMKDLVGYVVGSRDFLVGSAISVVVAGGIVGYSIYKWQHPEAPYIGGVFRSLYPFDLRTHPFATMDPDPLFNAFIYGLLGLMNVMALFRREPSLPDARRKPLTITSIFAMPNPAFLAALDFSAQQSRAVLDRYPGYQPMYTVGGIWRQEGELWTHWCDGFYPGIYWLLYKYTADDFWRQSAETASRSLEPRKYDRDVHDLGFLFFSTYLRWYHYAKDPALRDVLIAAGRTLALRRQMGGYLRSFIGPESLFIDIMMNVGLILWAGNQTENDCLRHIAIEHARTTRRTLLRPDGGAAHEGLFDVTTGDFLRESTHQGYKPESTWSRGQAWALYGFTAMHRLSGLPEFLDDARKTADCFLRRRGSDPIPLWDFDAPTGAPQPYDSSAAAIAASGLLDLAEQTNDVKERDRYHAAALETLDVLSSDKFLARAAPGWEGILLHGVYHKHKNLGVDESVAWGDHFFVEALVKAVAGQSNAAW